MRNYLFLLGIYLVCISTVHAQTGLPFTADSLHSKILNETRELRVILPKETNTHPENRYEVMYILDGEWYQELVPFTYQFAKSAGYVPECIFVLIRNHYHKGRNMRDRDFSPVPIPGDSVSGGADRFYDFLTREVVTYIEKRYPANGQRSLVGSSFSGLFSVYAFLKAPAFFQSFLASDPNLHFGGNHVAKLAARTLPTMPENAGTLFIAGNKHTQSNMGIAYFDSVLKANAPPTLRANCVAYENETHYSVQLKAFYDGHRFSHFGYSARPPGYVPALGIMKSGRSVNVYFVNGNESARYTIDDTEPAMSSPLMVGDQTALLTAPAKLRVRTFGNRPQYRREWMTSFAEGSMMPDRKPRKNSRAVLRYFLFDDTAQFGVYPDTAKAVLSGTVDSLTRLSELMQQRTSTMLLQGEIQVDSAAEYIFVVRGHDAAKLELGGQTLINDSTQGTGAFGSYVVSLERGRYSFRLLLRHHTPSLTPLFSVCRSFSGKDRWWEKRWMEF